MQKGMIGALMLLITGVALVLLAVPNLDTEVVASEEFIVDDYNFTLGPYDLSRGSYTVWVDTDADIDEENLRMADLVGNTDHVGNVPEEAVFQELEGVDAELVRVIGDVPDGQYELVLICDKDELEGTTLNIFLVRSPGTLEGFLVVTGLTLVIVAVIVGLLTRKRPSGVSHV
jgi:hypothetical protein